MLEKKNSQLQSLKKKMYLRVMLTPIPVVYDEMHFIKISGVFIERYHGIARLNVSNCI